MPDLEDPPEKYGGRVLGQELWYQGKQGPLFLLVVGLLAAISFMIWHTIDVQRMQELRDQARYDSLANTIRSNETQQRIGNWLMSIDPQKRPQLQMPPEAWGLLSEEAKKKVLQEYESEWRRR